jgi:flagellar biogenesis protein FliO
MKYSIFLIIPIILVFIYVVWSFGREFNYMVKYEDLVKKTILNNVKENCLKGE